MNQHEIYLRLHQQWPNLRIISETTMGNYIMADFEYVVPYLVEAEKIINFRKWYQFWIKPSPKAELFDCDDYSRKSMQDVRDNFSGGVVSYGRLGGRFPGISPQNHMLNVMVCQDGLLIHDFGFNRIWTPTAADKVWFVEM